MKLLHVSILAALFITLDADSDYSSCEIQIKVRRGTVYEASLGEDLRINCTVAFCNNSPPTVSWYKRGQTDVPVDVSSSTHIKTEWKIKDNSEGISFLIFKNILSNDSGLYQCESGDGVSHYINVSVHDNAETTSEPEEPIWPFVCRIVGIMSLVFIVVTVYVASDCGCKGKSRDTPSRQPSHDALPMTHI